MNQQSGLDGLHVGEGKGETSGPVASGYGRAGALFQGEYGRDPVSASGGVGEILDFRLLLNVLMRRKWLIIGLVLFVSLAAYLFVEQLTPMYRASAAVVIEPNRENVVDIQEVVGDLTTDWFTSHTEAAVIGSRELARRAVTALNLEGDSRFNPALRPPVKSAWQHTLDALQGRLVWLAGKIGFDFEDSQPAGDPPLTLEGEALTERLTSIYLSGLRVDTEERSRVLHVIYESPHPDFAALAANMTAELYVRQQRETKSQATEDAVAWLQRRVEETQAKVVDSETRLEAFRRESGLTSLEGATLPEQQLAQFSVELIGARTRAAEAAARYSQVQRLLRDPGAVDSAAAVLDSNLIQGLRVQEIEINRRISELATQYRDSHPKMILAKAELASLQEKIQIEIEKISANMRNELEVAQARERNLQAEVDRLEARINDLGESSVTLRTLEAEVAANKALFDTLLQRLKETNVQDDTLQRPDARIISRATVPGSPFAPRKQSTIALAAVAALGLALALVLALEFLDSGYRSLNQIENELGILGLGLVPAIELAPSKPLPHVNAILRQGTIYAEAIRHLRTALIVSGADGPPRLLVITSAVPNEGKTTTTLSIAAQVVQGGQRCIVIDCDLRKAAIGKVLRQGMELGLSDYLVGDAGFADIIKLDRQTGVHFIPAGLQNEPPVEKLNSPRMLKLLHALTESYDLVILDTPPLLAVSDALVLLREADATVFLGRWAKTRREVVQAGVKSALEAGAKIAGVALTYVDVKRHAQYHYSDSGYYYNKAYRKYYAK